MQKGQLSVTLLEPCLLIVLVVFPFWALTKHITTMSPSKSAQGMIDVKDEVITRMQTTGTGLSREVCDSMGRL